MKEQLFFWYVGIKEAREASFMKEAFLLQELGVRFDMALSVVVGSNMNVF